MEESKKLLSNSDDDLSDWEQQDCVIELKEKDPEHWQRSRQFVSYMKEFEKLLRLKLHRIGREKSQLDIELLITIYNLFLSLSS